MIGVVVPAVSVLAAIASVVLAGRAVIARERMVVPIAGPLPAVPPTENAPPTDPPVPAPAAPPLTWAMVEALLDRLVPTPAHEVADGDGAQPTPAVSVVLGQALEDALRHPGATRATTLGPVVKAIAERGRDRVPPRVARGFDRMLAAIEADDPTSRFWGRRMRGEFDGRVRTGPALVMPARLPRAAARSDARVVTERAEVDGLDLEVALDDTGQVGVVVAAREDLTEVLRGEAPERRTLVVAVDVGPAPNGGQTRFYMPLVPGAGYRAEILVPAPAGATMDVAVSGPPKRPADLTNVPDEVLARSRAAEVARGSSAWDELERP